MFHIEQNEQNEFTRVWLTFPDKRTGKIARKKVTGISHSLPNTISMNEIYYMLNENKTIER